MCAYRDGSAACQKRREWGLIAGGDSRPFAFPKFNKPLSSGVLRKHRLRFALLFLHWGPGLRHFGPHWDVFCQFRLDNLQWGPIVAFSADLFCRFLLSSAFAGTSDWVSAECFCEGLWPGFGSGRACDGLLQGILWSLSHDLLRRLAINVLQRKSCVCAWTRVSSCSENLALASGAGIVSQRTPVFAAESITIQCSTTVFRAHGREDRRSRAWNDQRPPSRIEACARGENGYPKARIVVASKPH